MKLPRPDRPRRRPSLAVELLEDRLAPTANLFVSVDGPSTQQSFREYTQQGTLLQTQIIPPGGTQQDARDLVVASDGLVHVYNGTSEPYLSSFDPGTNTWSQTTYSRWNTTGNYSGIGVYNNYVFVTDNYVSGDASTDRGVIRFNLADGTSTRFATDFDPQDLAMGRDGLVYAMNAFRVIRGYDPDTLALSKTVTLPSSVNGSSQFYTGIAVDANGDIFACTSSNLMVHRFDSTGAILGSITISDNGTSIGWLYDIDISADGSQLAVGTNQAKVAIVDTALTTQSWFATGASGTAYVAFGSDGVSEPALSIGNASVTEGNSGTATATFTVSLSPASSQEVTVNWSTADGSAAAGSDYTAGSGSLTFAPGETSKTISVAVLGDTLAEGNESFTVNLSGASGAVVLDGQGTGTILDDDAPPALSINDVSISEGNSGSSSALLTVSLSAASSQTVSVNWATSAFSASAGVDYTTASGTLVFAPGETSKTVSVAVLGDTVDENNESFLVNLSGAVNATIADSQGMATITDDDNAAASVDDVTVTEGDSGSVTATFTVTLATVSDHTVSVMWSTANNTAVSGSDYTGGSGFATFAPGETSKTVSVDVLGDLVAEPTENFFLNLLSGGGGIADGQGVGTILDNDPDVSLSIGDVSIAEGNAGTSAAVFTVTLSAASSQQVTVNWATTDDTATAGSDYTAASGTLTFAPGETSKTVSIDVLGDTLVEATEAFRVNLSAPAGAGIADGQGVGTILDNDPDVSLSIGDVSIAEGNAGTSAATFTVTLSAASSQQVMVNWATADDTATAGSDYTAASGTLTFAPGETSKTISIDVLGDTLVEATEAFRVNLSAPAGASISDGQGVGTIVNDDALPALTITDVSITEGNLGWSNATLTVSLSASSAQTVTVNWSTADGSAVAGNDYTAASGTLSFAPGETSKTFSVSVLGDTLDENDENAFVNLSGAVNATVSDGQATVTIADNDAAAASVGNVTVTEGDSGSVSAVFTVTLATASDHTISVDWSTAGNTATAGADFVSASGSLDFAPGETSKTVSVAVLGDTVAEPTESFYLNLTSATSGIADGQGIGTILDNEPPAISIGNATVTEWNSGATTASFTVTLSFASSQTVTVDWSTADGTAVSGSDYTAATGTLTFAPGETSKTVAISVLGDTIDENDETFTVNLAAPSNATIADGQGLGTITDDDLPPSLSIGDVSVSESAGEAVFTVSLSSASSKTVTVNYASSDFTASAGLDYITTSGSLTFAPGETVKTVAVAVVNDNVQESDEVFFVDLSGAVNASLLDSHGRATIVSDDVSALSINDVTVAEGDSGTVAATFTVTLSGPSDSTVRVDWATAGGTATADTDFESHTGWLTFSPGETTKTLTVSVINDVKFESDETFFVNLSNPSGASIADGQGAGTIVDDDPFVLNVDDVTVSEAAGEAVFTVVLSQPSSQTVSVSYATTQNSAIAGVDYTDVAGSLTFAPGETVKTVSVPITNDDMREYDENFFLLLSGVANAELGDVVAFATIQNDDPIPTISIDDVSVTEGDSGTTYANFTVHLSNPTSVTVDMSASVSDGTATLIWDYSYLSLSLSFDPGETTKSYAVAINGDLSNETDENFFVTLSNPSNATIADGQAVGTIVNDDFPPVANAGPDQTVAEGSVVTFDGSGSSDADGDTLSYIWNFGDGTPGGTGATPTHVYADNGVYTVTLSVSDGHGPSVTDTMTVTVNNVAPTAAVAGPTDGVRGQARTFTFSATDPGTDDTSAGFTYSIDWGDGTQETIAGPTAGVQVSHVFTSAASYTVTATAGDKDGAVSTAASAGIAIAVAQVQNGDVMVGGTTGSDVITLTPATGSRVTVSINGQSQGTLSVTGAVVVYGQAGDDQIRLIGGGKKGTSGFGYPARLFGDAGNDTLDAGVATVGVILVGGDGNDSLLGGAGRDVLIGGLGSDTLHGGGNDDILIGGTTSYDGDLAKLNSLGAEWTRTDADLATRVAHLQGTQSGGLNGTDYLNGTTAQNDGAVDELYGDAGYDWFIYVDSGTDADHLNDPAGGEAFMIL